MKTNKLIIGLLAVAAISLVSCEKFGADVETPSVSISVSPENPKVGEEVKRANNIFFMAVPY